MGYAIGFLGFPLPLYSLAQTVAFATFVCLVVWLYQVASAARGTMRFSPGLAAGAWFIPFANLVLPPMIVHDAWKAPRGESNVGLITGWWIAYVLHMGFMLAPTDVLYDVGYAFSLLITVAAFGLLALIVRQMSARS